MTLRQQRQKLKKRKIMILLNQYYAVLHHWHQIIDALNAWGDRNISTNECEVCGINYYGKGCAYCQNNLNTGEGGCGGCPISEMTEDDYCDGTPWHSFSSEVLTNNLKEAQIHAIRMRDFIIFSKPDEAK